MLNYRIELPRDEAWDSSIFLLLEGYQFIPNRCHRYRSNIFQTRLFGERVICISGKEAAEVFYDNRKFTRVNAAPKRIQKTLFGENGVQSLDGEAHRHRKQLFMSLMTVEQIEYLKSITYNEWKMAAEQWMNREKIILFDEARKIMCRIACKWAGVPLNPLEVTKRASDLSAMIDAFGGIGPRHWQGRQARLRSEQWIGQLIERVRNGEMSVEEGTALSEMARHRELNGQLMDKQVATVELLNILRPIVAIARYITFGALALWQYSDVRKNLKQDNDGSYSHLFVQEVRRYYPFGPFLGARVRQDFFWGGHDFKTGTLVLLDSYGMNNSPELWDNPSVFNPERFINWEDNKYGFIPQGGGDYVFGHRCAGERVTVEIMRVSLSFLAKEIEYEVPKQDLSYNLRRIPIRIRSNFVIENVKWTT